MSVACDSPPPRVSIVVPCYNEVDSLEEFYTRTTAACASVTPDYEILFVNDGSSDGTWPLILSFAAIDPHVTAVNLSRNHGHQMALTAGLAHCAGDRVLILDADLQAPPELLAPMMAAMDQGADVVYGKRRARAGESAFKRWTAYLFYRALNFFADLHIPEDTGDFRLITRRVVDVFNSMPENHRFIRGMIAWVGYKQVAFVYDRAPRFAGKTKYPLAKMLRFALDAITSFSVKPLRLAFYIGFTVAGLSLLLMAYSFVAYFEGRTIRGWASLTSILLFFLSIQFVLLGLIGEYVGRLYLEAKHRPLFVVQGVVRGQQTQKGEARRAQRA